MWYNTIMIGILRSPLHGLISGDIMLVTYQGRKSGKTYTTPVNYIRDGEILLVTSLQKRTWWRNLLGGAPVMLRLQGHKVKAIGEAFTDEALVNTNFLAILNRAPQYAKYFSIRLDTNGEPNLEEVSQAAKERTVIRFQL
jgi:deazaflavin-dependent oxidoreductase (nitroreductase family)